MATPITPDQARELPPGAEFGPPTATGPDASTISIPAPRTESSAPTEQAQTDPTAPRLLLRVEEAAELLAIGRTSMFAYVRSGAIESVKVGRLRRIPADALTAFVDRLATDQAAA